MKKTKLLFFALLSVIFITNVYSAENFKKEESVHYVGELYAGGVIFFVDNTSQHGLICSMIDLTISQSYSNVSMVSCGVKAQSDWDGLSNSIAIANQEWHKFSAAKLCLDYTNVDYGTGVYSDWYLPSVGELNCLWKNLYQVQKALSMDGDSKTTPLVRELYWSSTERDNVHAWFFSFYFGYTGCDGNKKNTYYVRAVRAF